MERSNGKAKRQNMIEANYKLKVTFRNSVLGSQSTQQMMTEHLAKKTGMALPVDEAESLPEALERAMTVFFRNEADEPVLAIGDHG